MTNGAGGRIGRIARCALLLACGWALRCSTVGTGKAPGTVTVETRIQRLLPVIVNRMDGQRVFEATVAHALGEEIKTNSDDFHAGQRIDQTYLAQSRSNTLFNLAVSPRPWLTVAGGYDQIGPSVDLIFRTRSAAPRIAVTAGAASCQELDAAGMIMPRFGLFLALAPKGEGTADQQPPSVWLSGDLTWTQYPVQIDLEREITGTSGYPVSGQYIHQTGRGNGWIAGSGLNIAMDWFRLYLRAQVAFNMSEPAIRLGLAAEPARLVTAMPPAQLTGMIGMGVAF